MSSCRCMICWNAWKWRDIYEPFYLSSLSPRAFDSAAPPRNLTPSSIPTIPAPASKDEQDMARELEGLSKCGAPKKKAEK